LYNDDRKAVGCPFESSLEPTEAVNPITTSQPAGTEHFFLDNRFSDDLNAAADFALVLVYFLFKARLLMPPLRFLCAAIRWDRTLDHCISSQLVSGELPFLEIMPEL
jgi:hypothetical protein